MAPKSSKLEAQILKRDQDIVGLYQKLQTEDDEMEKKTLVRDILLQKEINEALMESVFTS